MATASESPQPLPVPPPITAADEKDLITDVPESSYLLENLKKARAETNGTSETIESSKIAVTLVVPTDPVLETVNIVSEVHVAKEGECFLEPPPVAKLEKEETDREQDDCVIVEPSGMAEKEITDDQTQKMLKRQEEEEMSNREISTMEEIKENVEKEEGLNISKGFDTIQTKTEESIPDVGEETQKEEPLSQGTEIIVNKEAFYEEGAQKIEELSFPKEDDDPDETKADESVAEEKPLTEMTAGVSSHASLAVKVETEVENSKLVIDKRIVTESQKEAEDQTELVDQSIELGESLDDQRDMLTITEDSSLVKEEISTATEEQKEETVEFKENEERKEKDISAIEESKESSSQDEDPKVQTLDESLHVSSKNVETTDSSEIAKIQELSIEGKEEDNAAYDDHISENVVEEHEVIPPVDSDEKAEGEEVRASYDSHFTHAPIEETETGGKLLEEIQEEEFVNSAPHAENKFNEELSALDHPTNLGESCKLVDGDDLESNVGKESEKPVDQESSISPVTSNERIVMESEHKESSDKLETREIVSSNLGSEHNEEPSQPELEELNMYTDDVLIQQGREGSDRNDNYEEQTIQEDSYKTGLPEAFAENVVTKAETSPTIPTEEIVQKHITHEESSSTEIAPRAIVVETIQSPEEVKEDNTMDRAEVQAYVPTEAKTAECTSHPEVTEMTEDQTREPFVHSHISKEDIENFEAVNPVLEEKSEANEDDILTNEASPITAVDEKDLITNVPESAYLLEDLKEARAETNGTSKTIESSKIAVILEVPTDPVLETVNIVSEVHVAKEGECFLEPPPVAKLEKGETDREQDDCVIVEPSGMAEKEITDDQTQKMLKGQKEKEETSNREISTMDEIKENVEKEEGLNIPEGFDTIETKTKESIPEVGEETQKEEPLSQGTEIIVNKEAFCEELAQKVEELNFPKEDDPDEIKADESVAEEKPLTEVNAGVSSHASLVVKVETEEALDKEEENSKLVIDRRIVTESQKEAEDQTELVDQSIELEESLDDQRDMLTITEDSSLVKEEISTATEEQKEETVEVKEVEERKEKDISAIEEPKESSSQDDDPKVQTLDESLHVSSKNVETTYSSEIAKIQELSIEGKEEDNAANDDHISENVVGDDEIIPPVYSEEKAEGEEVRAAYDSHLTHAPIEETETGGKLLEEIQEEFLNSAPHAETKFNEELSALDRPTNLGESCKLVDGDDLESNAGKESEKPVDQEISISPVTSNERIVMESEHKESSDKLETREIVSSNLGSEHNEEPSQPELEELNMYTDDVLIQQGREGSDRNDNYEEQTIQEDSYKTGLPEAFAENVVTKAETSPTIPTEEIVQKHITHEESSSTEIAPRAIVVETIQSPEEVKEDNTMDRAEVQSCVPTEAKTAECTSHPEVTEMPEDQTRELFVHSHISKEDIENVEAVNPVLEEKSEANEDDILTNEASPEVAVNEKIEVVDSQEESATTEIIPLENDTVQKVRESKPDSLSLENAEIIKDEQVSPSDPDIIKVELEEVPTGSVAVQQSDARQIIEDKPEEMETKKYLEELTKSTKEQLEEHQINKDETTAHSQETETTKEELEEVIPKLAEEPQSEATKIVTAEQAFRLTEPESKDGDIEEETTESSHKQQVEEIITREPVAQLDEAKTEVFEEVKTDSAEEQQLEGTQIITNDQAPQSEEAKEGEIEEVTTTPAEEQQSQASQIITNERSIQPEEKDSEEITTELAEELHDKVITEIEPIPQSEAESVKEPEYEATQAITHDKVFQSEETESKKEKPEEVITKLAEEPQSESTKIVSAEQAFQLTETESKDGGIEEESTESSHKQQVEEIITRETNAQLDEAKPEVFEEVKTDSAEEQREGTQIITNDQAPQSEEAKEGEIEEVTTLQAEEQQSQASQIITNERSIQPEEKDSEEITTELAEELHDKVITEIEPIPQSEAELVKEPEYEATQAITHDQVVQSEETESKKEELEEVIPKLAEEPQSEATKIVSAEQAFQLTEPESKDGGIEEESTKSSYKQQVEEITTREPNAQLDEAKPEVFEEESTKSSYKQQVEEITTREPNAQLDEAKPEVFEEVKTDSAEEQLEGTQIITNDQAPQSEEAKEGEIEEVTTLPAEEQQSQASQIITNERSIQPEEKDSEEITTELAEELHDKVITEIEPIPQSEAELVKEPEYEATQAITHDQVVQSEETESKKEKLEEVITKLAEEPQSEATKIVSAEQAFQLTEPESKDGDIEEESTKSSYKQQVEENTTREPNAQLDEAQTEVFVEVKSDSAEEQQLEGTQIITNDQAPQSEEAKEGEIEEVTTTPAEEQQSQASQIITHERSIKPEEKDSEEITTELAEELHDKVITEIEPIPQSEAESVKEPEYEATQAITHDKVFQSEETESKKVKPEEVITKLAEEPQSEATKIVSAEQAFQLTEPESKDGGIEEESTKSSHKQQVEEITTREPNAQLDEAQTEVFEEVKSDSAEEQQLEGTQIITNDQAPQSEEAKEGEIEELTTTPAEEQQSQASQIIIHERSIQPEEKDSKEITTELAEELHDKVITEIEPIPQSEAESVKEPEYEATQAITHDQVVQSEETESKKEKLEEVITKLAEEPQSEATAGEAKNEKLEEVTTNSAKESQSVSTHAMDCEEVSQSEELDIKKKTREEGTTETVEEVVADSAKEIESESAKEQQVKAIQIVKNDQIPELEEAKKEELEELTAETAEPAEEQQSQASQMITRDRFIQLEEADIKIDPEETTKELIQEQQEEVFIANELIPQLEEAKEEELEEATSESAKEPKSEATQAVIREQVAHSEEPEVKKEDLVEGVIRLAEEEQVEVIKENELISQAEEAKKEELQEVTANPEEPQSEAIAGEAKKENLQVVTTEPGKEPQSEATAGEAKKESLQVVTTEPGKEPQSEATAGEVKKENLQVLTTEPGKEPQSGATRTMDCDLVAQSEELDIRKENLEEGTIEPTEEVATETERETESEASQAVVHEQVPQLGQQETKKEDIEERTIESAEKVVVESARETESEASQAVVHEQVPQLGQQETKKEDIEERTIESAEKVVAESARETESEASQAVVHEQVPQLGQQETKKEDIEERTIESAEKVVVESARETESEASQVVVHEQVPQSEQMEKKKEDIEEGTIESAEEVAAESERETESEASQAISHEQVGRLEMKKEDLEKETIEPDKEKQLQAIIQNELISQVQSEEAKDEPQYEAIPTISHEQVAQSEDTERKKVNLEEGTIETVGEDHKETIQVIENEPTPQSEEIKKEELQEVATKSVEERDIEVIPIIIREHIAQSEELENEHLGAARTESAKEKQVEAIQIIKSESTDQSEETKNELDGIRTETEEQQPLLVVQMIREQVAPSEVPQTKKGEVEEVTTDLAEEQKTEAIHMIKDEPVAQLEEDERDHHEEVPTQSVDQLQTEAVQIISPEQVVQSEQQDTKEDLETKEVATELAEGHQSEPIQIVKEQAGQSDELETVVKGAETVTTESVDEPKYEQTLSIKNDQATQSVEPESKIEDLAAVTTELAEEQLLGTVQINKNEEAPRAEESTTKTEDLVGLPTLSTEDEQFEAREITKKEISVEESAGEKEVVQPEEISNEIQQTDDIKPNDFPQKQDVNQQTEGAEKVDTTESLNEEIEQSEGAEKVDATESLKEEIGQIYNETTKHPLLHEDEIVPKAQNSEPILSETEKGQSENDEIPSEQQQEAPLPLATEAEPEKKEDEEKPEEICVVICDDLEEGPEVKTIQVDSLPKETATEIATSEPRQSQEISEVKGAQSDTLGVSQGDALLELELGTESTSCIPSEQPPQGVIKTERSIDYLEEVDRQLEKPEKAHETALEAYEQVAQPEVEKENPEEVITKSIQEPTEGTQINKNEAMGEIPQEKEMVSDSHQGSPEEENTHVIQPSEERVIVNEEEVQVNLEKKVFVATLEEKESEGFGEVVGREIPKEEIMPEEKHGDVEVSKETSKEILVLAKVNDDKEAAQLKNDEEVSDLQEASSPSENLQPNLNNETGEEKPRDVDILKSDEPEEIVKLKTAEQPTIESDENETKDSESEAHKSSQPLQTESAHFSSLDVCQDEEILDSKEDDNSPSKQLPVIETKISEDNLEVQSRGEIPETADSEEKKENPEEIVTESVQEEQIQTTQNSVDEHEIEKEVITEPREVTLPERITKELHEEEPKEEETDSATKIEEESRIAGRSRHISELIKEENTNDGLQSPEKEAIEEDLKETEEEFKTVGSSADSTKQEVQTPDSLTPVAEEDKEILPQEDVSEKMLKDEVTDRDMDFKNVKVAHVIEGVELKVSNDSAEEKAAVSEEESSAKELILEENNGSSVANLVVSEELDKQTVTESLKKEVSSGNDTESISVTAEDKEKLSVEVETKKEFQVEELNAIVSPPEEKDSAKTEEKGDFLVQDEDEKTTTKPLSEEDLLKVDSGKAVDATSEKAETISEDAETPSSGHPGIEMYVQEEEKREVETTQVVVDAIEKNEEPLTILSSKEELTEAESSKESVKMPTKGTVLFEDTQKEVPEKEPKEIDIQNFHESHVESDEMVDTAVDSLRPKQASQELEGSEEVDGRMTLEKEIRQEESATTELLVVNADIESNKEVREIEPVSVEALKPIEFNPETETSKLEKYEDLSDKQEVSTLSEEPKSQPDEIAEEKLEGPIKKSEDEQKEIETHGLESNPQDNISARALTIANAGGQSVVEGTSTPTLLDDSQDEEILYVGNVRGNVSSVTSELPTAVIKTEITKDFVEDTTLQSGFAEKMQGIAPQIKIHEEVPQLEYAEIKKDDIEEATTKLVEGKQIEAILVMKNDSNLVEEIVEKEEVTESYQVSPQEETLKEVKETDELNAERTVMQFSEETGKDATTDYVEEGITRKERALKDQLEADAEDKKTYVFIDDERQDINEEEAKLNLENKDSLPKLEAEIQLPEVTLGIEDERETFITSDAVNHQSELGVQTAKLTSEEENASSKAGGDNIGNGLRNTADEEKQPPAQVVGNPEKHPDHEKDANAPLKQEGGEFGIKFGVDEKGQEPRIKGPGTAVVDERCPEEMPEKSSQYIEPKPEIDFEKMGIKISNTDTYNNIADETQLNKDEEQGELLATERAWKFEETPGAASMENPKDASAIPVQESTAEGAQKAENFRDKDHTHCEETAQKDLEDEGEEHRREDSGSDGPVLVEASKDTEVNRASPHKKHHNILSGVGSKVKNSISKVKKAITGKSSSHPKSEAPK